MTAVRQEQRAFVLAAKFVEVYHHVAVHHGEVCVVRAADGEVAAVEDPPRAVLLHLLHRLIAGGPLPHSRHTLFTMRAGLLRLLWTTQSVAVGVGCNISWHEGFPM